MLDKEIFLKYANEKVIENIRRMIQPYPQTEDMQRKLQNVADWKYYKDLTMETVYKNIKKHVN